MLLVLQRPPNLYIERYKTQGCFLSNLFSLLQKQQQNKSSFVVYPPQYVMFGQTPFYCEGAARLILHRRPFTVGESFTTHM